MSWILLDKIREGATGSDRSESRARLLQCHRGKREPSGEPFFFRVEAVQRHRREGERLPAAPADR